LPGRLKTFVQPIKRDIIGCIHLRQRVEKLAFVLTKIMGFSLYIDEGNGIFVGRRQSKKTMRRTLYFLSRGFERRRMDLLWSWRSCAKTAEFREFALFGGMCGLHK
jgi:hypothetical protein